MNYSWNQLHSSHSIEGYLWIGTSDPYRVASQGTSICIWMVDFAPMSVWNCVVLILLGVLRMVDCAMVIAEPIDSPFAGIRMRSVPQNKYLGPQGSDPVVVNITADFIVVNGNNLCITNRDVPDEARGRVVLVIATSFISCPLSLRYTRLQEKDVAALIAIYPNGYDVSDPIHFYSNNRYQPEPDRNGMLFVAVEEPALPGVSLTDYLVNNEPNQRIRISIEPDVSDWDGFYHQWFVQLPLRWIPTAIFGAAFIFAAVFLNSHLQHLNSEFVERFPMRSMHTWQRRLKFFGNRFSIVHLILTIEFFTTFAMCAFIGIGGWQSNDVMPYQITEFFITGLSGWGFTCDVLSALLWTSIIKQMPGCGRHDSWLGHCLERHPFAKVALCVLPLLLDTFTCLCNLFYISIPYIYQFTAALIMVMQLVVGVQFLMQVVRLQNAIGQTVSQVKNSANADGVDDLLRRLAHWTLYLSFSMIAFVCFLPIAVTTFVYTHLGWVLFWGGGGTARALTSLCRVMMAKPVSARPRDTGRVVPLKTTGLEVPSILQ